MNWILALAAILLLLLATSAWSQPAIGGGGMGLQYNPQTAETVSGEVTQLQQKKRRHGAMLLELKTAKETLAVVLGPPSFLDQQKVKIAVGDKLEIKGSRIQHPQRIILIAAEVKKGNQVIRLRDENGKPLWSGQGFRRQ